MRLWNEYEGITIAGSYAIGELIRPEGRSAFFSATNGTGAPSVLRLIEAINDEAEILHRWQTVAGLEQLHLIKLKKFGQTVYMDTPLIYVLMEPTEGALADILKERPLTAEETRQIATSVVDALKALHSSGLIHEHVETANVLATAGDLVKLRSDCVREAPEGEEGTALKQKDVHDFAVVLLEALTQQKNPSASIAARLPAPFDLIVRHGISGAWGLAEIDAALSPPAPAVVTPRAPLVPIQTTAQGLLRNPARAQFREASGAVPETTPQAESNAGPKASIEPVSSTAVGSGPQQLPLAMSAPVEAPATVPDAISETLHAPLAAAAAPHQGRITVPLDEDPPRRRLWLLAAPVVIVLAGVLGWHALHRTGAPAGEAPAVTTLADGKQPNGDHADDSAPAPVATPSTAASIAAASSTPSSAGGPWRVVAYTYNRRDQAQHKVVTVAERDMSLKPSVYKPEGSSSFLVLLGGAMSRDEAVALRQKALADGLPRDVYIQNYETRAERQERRRR